MDKVKFGDIVTIRLAKDEFYLSVPGFIQNDIMLKKIFSIDEDDVSECLYRIIPPLNYQTLQHCNQETYLQQDQAKLLEDLAEEFIEQDKVKKLVLGQELTFNQDFLLQHVSSKKILSLQEDDNGCYILTLEMIPKLDFTFNLIQFFKFRNNKENSINYNEKIIISMSLMKDRYKQYLFDVSDTAIVNLPNVKQIEGEDLLFNVEETRFTPVIFQLYDRNQEDHRGVIKAGDVISINHLKSLCNVNLQKSQNYIEMNEDVNQQIKQQQQQLESESEDGQSQLIIKRPTGKKQSTNKLSDSNQLNFQNHMNKQVREGNSNIFVEYPQEYTKISTYWIVEKDLQNQGGIVKWNEKFRLRNMENGLYLSFEDDHLMEVEGIKNLKSSFKLDGSTLFFIEDEKGKFVDKESDFIDYNETFSIQQYFGGKNTNNYSIDVYFDNRLSKYRPKMAINALQVESFKFVKLQEINTWEMRFIKDCQKSFLKAITEFHKFSQTDINATVDTKQQIDLIKDSMKEIENFIFSEGFYTGSLFKLKTQNQKRADYLVVSDFHELLLLLIDAIFPDENQLQKIIDYSQSSTLEEEDLIANQFVSQQTGHDKNEQYQQLNNYQTLGTVASEEQTHRKFSAKRRGTLSFQGGQSNNLALVKKLKIDNGGQLLFPKQLISTELVGIVEQAYQILSYLVPSKEFPQNRLQIYSELIIQQIGYGLNIWNCLNQILSKQKSLDSQISNDLIQKAQSSHIFQTQNISYLHLVICNFKKEFISRSQPDSTMIELMASICISQSKLNRNHQYLIGRVIFDKKFFMSNNFTKLFIHFKVVNNKIEVKYIDDYIELVAFCQKTQATSQLYQILYQQLKLFSLICEERNYQNICILRYHFPYLVLHQYITNSQLPYIYRSALFDLYIYLYVDVNPRSHHMTWETKLQGQNQNALNNIAKQIINTEQGLLKDEEEYNKNLQHLVDDFEKLMFITDEEQKVIQSGTEEKDYKPDEWVQLIRKLVLQFFEETFKDDNYKQLVTIQGYYNYILSMVRGIKVLITLKEFDISDPDCEDDDKILKWIFRFLQSLDTGDNKKLDLRSKAARQGLGQSSAKPHLKTLQMDFSCNNTNSEIIQSLKALILDIYELKLMVLQDQTIDAFIIDVFGYINHSIKPINSQLENPEAAIKKEQSYAITNFPNFAKNQLNIEDSINNGEEFEISSKEFISMLFQQLQKSSDYELDFKLLKIIFQLANRKSEFLKQIRKTQFMSQQERKANFAKLSSIVETMRHLQQRSSSWILVKDPVQQKLATMYQLQIEEIINSLNVEDRKTKQSNAEQKEDYLYNMQKSIYSLDFHSVLLAMIKENLQHTLSLDLSTAEGQLIIKIFQSSFELLRMLIKDNQSIKKELIQHLDLFLELMNMQEYGQTRLIIDLFTDDLFTQSHITPKLLTSFVKSIRKRMGQSDIDPSLLRFLEDILCYQQDLIENNMKMIIDNIFYTELVYDFFGMELKEVQQYLQPQDQNQGKYFYQFQLEDQADQHLAYIYQAYSFRVCRDILAQSKNFKKRLISVLQRVLNMNYVFLILEDTSSDFFVQQNQQSFKKLIFKSELIQLINDVWLSQQMVVDNIESNESMKKFVQLQNETLSKITKKDIKDIRVALFNIRQTNKVENQELHEISKKFIKENAPTQALQNTAIILDEYDYPVFILSVVLPFMVHLKKALILRIQSKGVSSANVNRILRENEGWQVLDDFADNFIEFFEEKLSNEEQIVYQKFFKNGIMDFKTIFQRDQPKTHNVGNQLQIDDILPVINEEPICKDSIGKNLPLLRNVLCIARGKYDTESFKNILIQLLTNQEINETCVQDESETVLELLQQNFKQSKEFDTKQIIDHILKFMEVSLTYMQQNNDVRNVLTQAIQLLSSFLEQFEGKELKKIQDYVFDSSLKRILMDTFGYSQSYRDELLMGQIFRLVIALLNGGNKDIQVQLMNAFYGDSKIENLVFFIDNCIQSEMIRIQNMNLNPYMKKYIMLNEISYTYDKSDRHVINHCYNFIQSLNQDHYKPFQLFWKVQNHCNNSFDILDTLVKLLDIIVRFQFNNEGDKDNEAFKNTINMNAYQKEMMKESLETILSLIQGKCQENKQKVLQSSLIDNFREMIKIDEFGKIDPSILKGQKDELLDIGLQLQQFYEGHLKKEEIILLKNMCFEITEHLIENDKNSVIRKKIVRTLTFKICEENLANIYGYFLTYHKGKYTLENSDALEYGFQVFLLLRDLDETNKVLVSSYQSSLEKKKDLSYQFYNAYMFFHKNTAYIEIVNESGQLQDIHFAYLPHFNALNSDIVNDFEDLIERSNSQAKLVSLMKISKNFNEKLLNEQKFLDAASVSPIFKVIITLSQNQPYLRAFNFFITIIDNIYLLFLYAPDGSEGLSYDEKIKPSSTGPRALDSIFFQITLWLQNVIVILLFVFFIIQNKTYITWLIKEEFEAQSFVPSDGSGVPVLQGLQKTSKRVGKITKIKIWIKYWCTNMSVAYFMVYTPILLLSNFYHELFVTLLLMDFMFRFPETQNVFKAFWAPKWKLLTNIFLYILFMYYFAIFAYLTLTEFYHGTCENLLSCFSVIFDNAQKQRISKLYATLDNYQTTEPSYLTDSEDLFDFFFMLFVVSCIWTWTFTSLIIESYGALRRNAAAKFNDIHNICAICTFPREKITKIALHGFDKHTFLEHNQWNFLRYMASLHYKPSEQFTGTEKYVYENISTGNIHWFPIEKSLKFTKAV